MLIVVSSLYRPTRNQSIYLSHQPAGLLQRNYDLLVLRQFVIGERPTFAVFEPLLADLVAADVELPDLRRYTLKVLRLGMCETLVEAGGHI